MGRMRNPAQGWMDRAVADQEERRAVLVTEGADSPTYTRLRLRGAVHLGAAMLALWALVLLVPERYEIAAAPAALLVLSATMRHGALRHAAAARDYVDGWVEGRMALCSRLVDEVPNGTQALLDALSLENHRDVEVVMDIRTVQAPDDLSGLADD